MIIKIDEFDVNFIESNNSAEEVIIFLHGFSGSCNDWKEIFELMPANFRLIAFDFPGHGDSSIKEDLIFYEEDYLHKIINGISSRLLHKNFSLCGYSMGGRAALSYSLKYQNKIKKLILESSTAGINDKLSQQKRVKSDELLCQMIQNNGIDYFVNYWMELDLFKTLKRLDERKYKLIKKNKLMNNPMGLINSLKGFGTGKMNSLWDSLPTLKVESLLIAGVLDKKFVKTNRLMFDRMPNSRFEIVKDSGHNVHLEKPKEFAELLINFIS